VVHEVVALFARRPRWGRYTRFTDPRNRLSNRAFLETLEPRTVFATYDIESITYLGSPIDGWSVFGMAEVENLTITTTAISTAFTSKDNLTVLFGGQGLPPSDLINVTDHSVTLTLPSLTGIPWNGTSSTSYGNITFSDSGASGPFSTSNNSFTLYPANLASIENQPITVNASATLTLVATDAQHGFGHLTNHPFFLVGNGAGPNNVSTPFVGNASDSTHLTINITPSPGLQPGHYTLQTTPTGTQPSNDTDTANFALVGHLNVAVEAINYTIASITYQNQPISGWSYLGSGNETINITLANGSTPFSEDTNVWFKLVDGWQTSVPGTVIDNLTLAVAVPYYGNYSGSEISANLSFGLVPNNDTTNGSFIYHGVELASLSSGNGYLAGGGTLTLTANSAEYGFGNNATFFTVWFQDTSNASQHTSGKIENLSLTELNVTVPAFTGTGNYSVYLTQGSVATSNNLPFEVQNNPVIANLTITFDTSWGLNSTTTPANSDFYLFAYGNVASATSSGNLVGGWLAINATSGVVGTTANTTANATHPFPGTSLASLTGNFSHNAVLAFNLTDTIYNGTRLYLSNVSAMGTQPKAGLNETYYDFVELSAATTGVYVDTSQVDQFGMPLTLDLSLDGTQNQSSGISPGLTRQDIIENYGQSLGNVAGYNLAVVPEGGVGNEADPTYRILAPNDLLLAKTSIHGFTMPAGNASEPWNATVTQESGSLNSTVGNFTNWATLTLSQKIDGLLYPNGSLVSGGFIPAGTVIAEANVSNTATTFKIATHDSRPFGNHTLTLNGTGGLLIQQVDPNMTSVGYQALANAFGPSVFHFDANGNPELWDNATLNEKNAIDRMFERYQSMPFWQEENQPTGVLTPANASAPNLTYPQAVALYRGEVSNVTYTSIENTTENYAALVFTDWSTGVANPNLTYSILYPYFTTNSPANKVDPFGRPVPPPPSWFQQKDANYLAPSVMIFGGADIFQPGGPMQSGSVPGYYHEPGGTAAQNTSADQNMAAVNDLGRDVAVALSRGYASTMLSTGEPINKTDGNLSQNLPVFHHTSADNTTGYWTMPTSVYQNAINQSGNASLNVTGWVLASYLNFDSPMTITDRHVGNATVPTVLNVTSYVTGAPIDIKNGKNVDNLQFVQFANSTTTYSDGSPIPYNRYEAWVQSRGEFADGVSNGTGREKLNINGLGYGYAFSDFMGLSSTIVVTADTTLTAPAQQSAAIIVTMQPWFNSVIDVSYDIEEVSYAGQSIEGWSLFGSGGETITITTTASSTAFVQNDTVAVSFGGTVVNGTATGNHTLNVTVPALTSLWQGSGSSFANLTIAGQNTTGNTTFDVLAVNLTSVSPNNGSVVGGTNLTLTASSPQYGFGNATDLSMSLARFGVTAAATNLSVQSPTSLTLQTPAVGEPGEWSMAVYKGAEFTTSNQASNVLAFAYTEGSLVFLSGDFNADNLTDVATLLDDGSWEVSFTQTGGNATLVVLSTSNAWTTAVTWADWSVLRRGDRDVIVARAETETVGSWWKLSYDGVANGTAATDFSTNFVGSWAYANGTEWLDVVNGDFDGDGAADIAGRDSTNGQWWMLSNATGTANLSDFGSKNILMGAWHPNVTWDQTLAGNFLGLPGGKDQIAGLTGSQWWISEYESPGNMSHTLLSTKWSPHSGTNYTDYVVGNFDGNANDASLIAAKTETNAWYSLGYNATLTPENNTPNLMGVWPDHTSTYTNVVTGDFQGADDGTVGIAGLQRASSNLSWYVLERSTGGSYSVSNYGPWPQTSVAQAFAGYFSAADLGPPRRKGILTRAMRDAVMVWEAGASTGTQFTPSEVTGYPS
jgi:tellurite resistance-related uncharacterized protein